ncbi:hypothetical protein BKA56DRAFT_725995 [Ilyonectria sp. MPI-CAGE-AT-0026]|nr:hypothetical protein BKA56DRAFT_725995 [Ilyonectria sp. MPI-CAGE-AT-0026]
MEEVVDKRGSLSPPSSQATPRAKQDTSISRRADTTFKTPTLARDKQPSASPKDHDNSFEIHLMEEMELMKTRYPGASSWAPDEERLFEILYMRQDLPMLPPTWDIDLSVVPISDILFQTSDEYPPIIYAHAKDFRATMALMRLIDLTREVRAKTQVELRKKAPRIIKRELDKYLTWAAQDGDYEKLRIVPNIVTEVIDTTMPESDITQYLQDRMRALARLQREFLREDRDPEFWDVLKPSIMVSPMVKSESDDGSPMKMRAQLERLSSPLGPDELSVETPTPNRSVQQEVGRKRKRLFPSPTATGVDELAECPPGEEHRATADGPPPKRIKLEDEEIDGDEIESEEIDSEEIDHEETDHEESDSEEIESKEIDHEETESEPTSPSPEDEEPVTPPQPKYRYNPPVVYGLFILNTTVLLLTIDAAQGDSAYVSFHVQANFQDSHQSVWNALTIALTVCLARDELMTRASDFEELPVIDDSDPDA